MFEREGEEVEGTEIVFIVFVYEQITFFLEGEQ